MPEPKTEAVSLDSQTEEEKLQIVSVSAPASSPVLQDPVAARAVVPVPSGRHKLTADEKKRRLEHINAVITTNASAKPSSTSVAAAPVKRRNKPAVGSVIMQMMSERSRGEKTPAMPLRTTREPTLPPATPPKPLETATPAAAQAASKRKTPAASGVIEWTPTAVGDNATRWKRRRYNDYISRSEIVLRSGYRGAGQSKTINWGKMSSVYSTHEEAKVAAQDWVERNSSSNA